MIIPLTQGNNPRYPSVANLPDRAGWWGLCSVPSERMSLRIPAIVSACSVGACAIIWLLRGLYIYWNDPKLVNFLAAWIPLVLSILLAFVPEHKMSTHKKIVWRSAVITIGFIWSLVLWHQQVIAEKALHDGETTLITEAVTQSNQHSDKKMGELRDEVVQGVRKDVQTSTDALTGTIAKSDADLNTNIGKVGAPPLPVKARLQFSLWHDNITDEEMPLLLEAIGYDKDGSVPVEFSFTNVSPISAEAIDIWVNLCDGCTFAKEPSGFENPSQAVTMRHKGIFPLLNPGVTGEIETIVVNVPHEFPRFSILLRYSCKTCVLDKKGQLLTVDISPYM